MQNSSSQRPEEEEKHAAEDRKFFNYKDQGLDDTQILRRIANDLGIPLGKKGNKANASPKATSKGKGGAGKSAAKKAKQVQQTDLEKSIATKSYVVSAPIREPMFRYIPDRETMQRLITRCSNMKDDLAEFDLAEDAEMAGENGENTNPVEVNNTPSI